MRLLEFFPLESKKKQPLKPAKGSGAALKMPVAGVEPARYRYQRILSYLRDQAVGVICRHWEVMNAFQKLAPLSEITATIIEIQAAYFRIK